MEQSREAEHALVTALVIGEADPAELSGRLTGLDFADPAAGLLFDVALAAGQRPGGLAEDLPSLLQRQGLLRSDGYPISRLVEWTRRLPAPVHPEAWATLIVAGSLARQVHACGDRVLQSVEGAQEHRYGPGRVLAVAEAQRAALVSAGRRWERLPQRWRDTVPSSGPVMTTPAEPGATRRSAEPIGAARERDLLAGLVAAPQLLGRLPWLRSEDFTDSACGSLFRTLRHLHEFGHPVDVVTLAAFAEGGAAGQGCQAPAAVAGALRPDQAVPSAVPFLAREVLAQAVVVEAQAVGEDLIRLARTTPAAGGVGGAMITIARGRLDSLRPHQLRVENASSHRRATNEPRSLTAVTSRLWIDRPPESLDRHAG